MTSSRTPLSRIAVVTGGTAGVGRATVRELADHGYDVAILARGRAGLDGAVDDVEERGRRALAIAVDVSDGEAVDAAAERVEQELGEIDLWVNNAFVGSLARFWELSPEEFRRIHDVTYFGQVHGTRAALRHMRPRDRGTVVNVSSALAHRGIPLQSSYCAAKHAIKGFSESVRVELLAEGSHVHVGLVTLPGVNTPQFTWNLNRMPGMPMPVPPLVTPEVAARAIRVTAERRRRSSLVGSGALLTIVGETVAPWFMDAYLARTGFDGQQSEDVDERYDSNVFEPSDEDRDHGAAGPFVEEARSFDPVSLLGRTLGRGLDTVGRVADAVARAGAR